MKPLPEHCEDCGLPVARPARTEPPAFEEIPATALREAYRDVLARHREHCKETPCPLNSEA